MRAGDYGRASSVEEDATFHRLVRTQEKLAKSFPARNSTPCTKLRPGPRSKESQQASFEMLGKISTNLGEGEGREKITSCTELRLPVKDPLGKPKVSRKMATFPTFRFGVRPE